MSRTDRKRAARRRAEQQALRTQASTTTDLAAQQPQVLRPDPMMPRTKGGRAVMQQTITEYQGPVPPAEFLQAYSVAIPNGGERLFSMIEAESLHVRDQERTMLNAQVSLLRRGQIFAFVIALVSMGGAVYTAQFSVALATAMLSIGVGTLAVAFLGRGKAKANDQSANGAKNK